MTRAAPARTFGRGVLAFALALAVVNVCRNLQPVALGWDGAEYVWAVRAGMLPHAPYVGHLAVSKLAALFLPAPLALSVVSALAYVGATALLFAVLRNFGERSAVAALAAFLFMAAPVSMRQACIQEVYALQTFCVLLALWLATSRLPRGAAWSGLAFGFAVTVHTGTVFTAPAFLYVLCRRRPGDGRGRLAPLGAWIVAAGAVGTVAIGFLLWALAGDEGAVGPTLDYLRNASIAPVLDARRIPLGIGYCLKRFFVPSVVGWPAAVAALLLLGLVIARRDAAPWLLYAAGYLVLDASLPYAVELGTDDRGVYMVYFVVPVAALAARGLARLAPRDSPRTAAGAAGVAVLAFALLGFYGDSLRRTAAALPRQARERFLNDPATLGSRWIEENLPRETIVVQPRTVTNANLLPSIHLRRPIILHRGTYRLLEHYRPWTPMHLSSYVLLTPPRLGRLLAAGLPIVAFDRALEREVPGLRLVEYPVPAGDAFRLYRVVRVP